MINLKIPIPNKRCNNDKVQNPNVKYKPNDKWQKNIWSWGTNSLIWGKYYSILFGIETLDIDLTLVLWN